MARTGGALTLLLFSTLVLTTSSSAEHLPSGHALHGQPSHGQLTNNLNHIITKRGAFRSDLGKRDDGEDAKDLVTDDLMGVVKDALENEDEEESEEENGTNFLLADDKEDDKRMYRADLGKRLYRADLGRRSTDEVEDEADEVEKKAMFRSDLGKRGGVPRLWYGRRVFRSDLGKRAYRSDLG